MTVSGYGMHGYAMISCRTLRQAYEVALKYHSLAEPVMALHWHQEPKTVVWTIPTTQEMGLEESLHRFLLEQQLAMYCAMHRDLMSGRCKPISLHLADVKGSDAVMYEQYLGCRTGSGSRSNELRFNIKWLDRLPVRSSRIAMALVNETSRRILTQAHLVGGRTCQLVQRFLMHTPGAFPGIDEVAAHLETTTRTLRRRLDHEGSTYAMISAQLRHALAVDYLRSTSMTVEDVAAHLGFSDAANFRAAFRKWTGHSPSQVRNAAP